MAVMAAWLAIVAAPSVALSAAEETPLSDEAVAEQLVVYGRALERIGEAVSASEGTVGYRDFQHKPISRVGELAENVPGLIATQHSGTASSASRRG